MPNPNGGLGALVTSLKGFVTEILSSRGFVITERDPFLLAKKGEVEVAICLIGAGEEKLLPAFLDSVKRFKGKKLVVSIIPVPEIPPERLDGDLIIWDREALEQEIGRTHLEKLVGDSDRGLVDELVADDYPRLMTQADVRKLEGAEVGERIVRPTIDSRDVKEIGLRTVGGFRQKLELVPYYIFDYTCPLYQGDIKPIYADCAFDETLTLRHSADFAGNGGQVLGGSHHVESGSGVRACGRGHDERGRYLEPVKGSQGGNPFRTGARHAPPWTE